MKRLFAVGVVLALMLSICGCSKTSVNKSAEVTLTYIYQEANICVTLENEESTKIIDILHGNSYNCVFGIPSCGFDKNISLKVGNRVFAIACDTCNCIQDLGNLRFFDISKEEMDYIHSLFEKYGGGFPCV